MTSLPSSQINWIEQLALFQQIGKVRRSLSPRLLVRASRAEGESRAHYLMRLSQENGFEGIEELARVLQQTPTMLLSLTDKALDQFLRGVPTYQLASPKTRAHDALELIRRRLWGRSRNCPICIRENILPAEQFDFSLTLRCERHQTLLWDRCIRCGALLTYGRKYYSHCDCGEYLGNLPEKTSDSSIDLFYFLFAPWRQTQVWATNPDKCMGMEISSAFAIRTILSFMDDDQTKTTRCQPWVFIEDWPRIQPLVSPWPDAIIEHLSALWDGLSQSSSALLLSRLKNAKAAPLSTLADTLRASVSVPRTASYSLTTTQGDEPMVALGQIRQIGKLDADAVTKLFQSSFFQTKCTTGKGDALQYWVSQAEARKFTEWINQTIDADEAAHILNCHSSHVAALTRYGFIEAALLPVKPRSPRFSRSSVDSMLMSFNQRSLAVQPMGCQLICLSDIPASTPGCKYWFAGWKRLVSDLLTGSTPLHSAGSDRGWKSLGIRSDQINDYFSACWVEKYVHRKTTSLT